MKYTIKAVGDWEIEILAVPFGDSSTKDSDGEYFTKNTNLHLDKYPLPPLVYFHGWDDPKKQSPEPAYIGKTISYEIRSDGVWFRGVLDKANRFAQRVWEAVRKNAARASSGSVAHLVRKAKDGMIQHWPLAEISVFDLEDGKRPANQHAIAVPVLKAVYETAGIQFPAFDIEIASQPEADARGVLASTQRANAAEGANTQTNNRSGVIDMNEEQVKQMVADSVAAALKAQADAAEAKAKSEADEKAKLDAALKAQSDQFQVELQKVKDEAATGRRLPLNGDAPYQTKFAAVAKFDGMTPADMAVMYGVLQAAKRTGRSNGPSEELRKAMAIAIVEDKDEDGLYRSVKAQMAEDMPVALKANELNQSTLANYGDEWVGVTYSTQLWNRIVLPTSIVGKIPTLTVPQGSESIIIPLEAAPPTFYLVAQASAQATNPGRVTPTVITSKLSTANQTLSVRKLGAAVNYTGELEEDSMIPWASELRRSMTTEANIVLEHILIDGDTATGANVNINDIAGTPAGNEPFLLLDGFRKLALVTNTANSRDAGSLDVVDFLETVKLLGLSGQNAVDQNSVGFIVSSGTHWATLNLTEVKNRDYTIASPTLDSGRLTSMWGYDVFPSPYMHRANQDATYGLKANDAGKIDLDVAANNTKGAILAVRWDQWRLGWKRRMTFEIERDAISDSTAIVVMMRLGMVHRDVEASGISFNVTI